MLIQESCIVVSLESRSIWYKTPCTDAIGPRNRVNNLEHKPNLELESGILVAVVSCTAVSRCQGRRRVIITTSALMVHRARAGQEGWSPVRERHNLVSWSGCYDLLTHVRVM